MKLERSDEALADLDRFVEFLNQERPSLASIIAGEIVFKVQVLIDHPTNRGSRGIPPDRIASSSGGLRLSI